MSLLINIHHVMRISKLGKLTSFSLLHTLQELRCERFSHLLRFLHSLGPMLSYRLVVLLLNVEIRLVVRIVHDFIHIIRRQWWHTMGYLLVFWTTRCGRAEFTRHAFNKLLSDTFSLLFTLRRQIALDMALNCNLQIGILH